MYEEQLICLVFLLAVFALKDKIRYYFLFCLEKKTRVGSCRKTFFTNSKLEGRSKQGLWATF